MILARKIKKSKDFLQIFGMWKKFLDNLWNSDKLPTNFGQVSAQVGTKIANIWRRCLKICEKIQKFVTKMCWIVEVGEVQRNVNLVDLVKSLLTSIYYWVAKIGFDTAENEPFNFHNFSSLQGFNFHWAVVSLWHGGERAFQTPATVDHCSEEELLSQNF